LQRGEVRNGFQFDDGAQVRAVGQEADDAAVVGLEELFQDQAGEQLMLCELLGAEAVGVSRQGVLGRGVRHLQRPPWRFAGRAHAALCTAVKVRAQS